MKITKNDLRKLIRESLQQEMGGVEEAMPKLRKATPADVDSADREIKIARQAYRVCSNLENQAVNAMGHSIWA